MLFKNIFAIVAALSASILAAPVAIEGRDAAPDAKPQYGDYGNYGDYGAYGETIGQPTDYGTYGSYGAYKRDAEAKAAPVEE